MVPGTVVERSVLAHEHFSAKGFGVGRLELNRWPLLIERHGGSVARISRRTRLRRWRIADVGCKTTEAAEALFVGLAQEIFDGAQEKRRVHRSEERRVGKKCRSRRAP